MNERNAVLVVAIAIVLVLASILFLPKFQEATKPVPQTQTPEYCESKGAAYKGFTNGCMDSCILARNPDVVCTQSLTSGCDCGKEKCWNGFECEPNRGEGFAPSPVPGSS
ncbi:MAG: hypothetical protein ABIF01_02275 [Candidatus Micrarchaeota archaeon]